MCKANKYLEKLNELTGEFLKEKKKLEAMQSILDRKISIFYHDLESREKFNAAEGYYIAKELQMLLRKRRIVKQELFEINALNNTIRLQDFSKSLPKAEKSLNKIEKDQRKGYAINWEIELEDFEHELIN